MCFKGVLMECRGCFEGIVRVFHGSVQGVLRVFKGHVIQENVIKDLYLKSKFDIQNLKS